MSTRAQALAVLWSILVVLGAADVHAAATICGDVDGNGQISATDGLMVLKKGVGQNVVLECPSICSTTTSTTTTTMPSSSDCTNNGICGDDDCVCPDCDADLFCSNPANCNNNGTCTPFTEGCVCVDCMTHPECLDN